MHGAGGTMKPQHKIAVGMYAAMVLLVAAYPPLRRVLYPPFFAGRRGIAIHVVKRFAYVFWWRHKALPGLKDVHQTNMRIRRELTDRLGREPTAEEWTAAREAQAK
jgi:hypothetical protein